MLSDPNLSEEQRAGIQAMKDKRIAKQEARIAAEGGSTAMVEEGVPPGGSSCVRVVLGTMTMGPAVGNAHVDGTHTAMKSWCQTPPDVAALQLKALFACPHACVKGGPEDGKVLVDTASAYQNWQTEKVLGAIFAADPEL